MLYSVSYLQSNERGASANDYAFTHLPPSIHDTLVTSADERARLRRISPPAGDYIEGRIDLNRDLIKHKIATFHIRAIGDSMRDARVAEGDLLVVYRAERLMTQTSL